MLTSNNAFEDAFNAGAAVSQPVTDAPAADASQQKPSAPRQPSAPPSVPEQPPTTTAPSNPFSASSTESAQTTAHSNVDAVSGSGGPRPLVEFKQEEPCKGKEWRPKTYFVISSRVLVSNNSFHEPVYLEGPHLAGFDSGVRRNDWDRGSHATVERRYSELHDLRQLLVYQFPTLIIPPLPAKKLSQNVETTFNAVDAATLQQNSIELFLRDLGRMPEAVFFSFFVSGFFMNPRQTFTDITLPAMQACLAQYRERCRPLHQCSERHQSMTESARDAITASTSWLVRGVASYVSRSTPEKSSAANDAEQPVRVVENDEYHLSALADSQRKDGERWLKVAASLKRRRKLFKECAELYEKALVTANKAALQEQHVAESLEAYRHVAEAAQENTIVTPCTATTQLFDQVAMQDRALIDGRYVNVRRRLAYERNSMDAAMDAVDHVLSIYAYTVSSSSQETAARKAAFLEYATALSGQLWTDYDARWQAWYRAQMLNLCHVQLITPRSTHALKVKQLAESSRLATVLQTNGTG